MHSGETGPTVRRMGATSTRLPGKGLTAPRGHPVWDGTPGWLGSGLRVGWTTSKITCQKAAPSSKQGREAASEGKRYDQWLVHGGGGSKGSLGAA